MAARQIMMVIVINNDNINTQGSKQDEIKKVQVIKKVFL